MKQKRGIHAIIFSKNRPMQLDALLRTLIEYCNIFDRVSVLYKAGKGEFGQAYAVLEDEYRFHRSPLIEFVEEDDFNQDTLKLLNSEYSHTTFLVDDCMFIAGVEIPKECLLEIVDHPDVACFSLRLGKKSRNCPATGIPSHWGTILWEWRSQVKNFAYPMSTDGHVFQTEKLLSMAKQAPFQNPNRLEVSLQRHREHLPELMAAVEKQALFSNPLNRVSPNSTAAAGEKYPLDSNQLLSRFMKHRRIDYHNMDFSKVNDCHREVELKFEDANKL